MNFYRTPIEDQLNLEIASLLKQLSELDKTSEEYGKITDRVVKLHKLKSEEAQNALKAEEAGHKFENDRKLQLPSLDTALLVTANLIGIYWLTRYERENIITSKALPFVKKL